jgi:SpoVK/Ycf46/Vps4 family AAA+-type ATPase
MSADAFVCGYRGDVSSGVSDRVISQLLTELDGVHVSYALIVPAGLLPYAVC